MCRLILTSRSIRIKSRLKPLWLIGATERKPRSLASRLTPDIGRLRILTRFILKVSANGPQHARNIQQQMTHTSAAIAPALKWLIIGDGAMVQNWLPIVAAPLSQPERRMSQPKL